VNVINKLIYIHVWRCTNRRINKVTLIEQILRDEDPQMYVDTTDVWDCVRNKALVYRRNDVMRINVSLVVDCGSAKMNVQEIIIGIFTDSLSVVVSPTVCHINVKVAVTEHCN
jgi:hypothetical protein